MNYLVEYTAYILTGHTVPFGLAYYGMENPANWCLADTFALYLKSYSISRSNLFMSLLQPINKCVFESHAGHNIVLIDTVNRWSARHDAYMNRHR